MFIDYKVKQPIAYNILNNQFINNKLSHAYIFTSDLEFAKTFAAFILDNKNEQQVLKRINNGNFPDMEIINEENENIKKDQIINLQSLFSKKPLESEKQVYIINHAERMNSSSYNTLLKFLEEPEDNIIAILLTSDVNLLPKTIISRCQIIPFLKQDEFILENELYEEDINIIIQKLETSEILSKKDIDKILERNVFLEVIDNIILKYHYAIENYKKCNQSEIVKFLIKQNDIKKLSLKINILINSKKDIEYNGNLNLILDKVYIKFGGM